MNLCPLPGGTPIHQKNISRQTENPGSNRVVRVVCGSRPVHLKESFLKEIVSDVGAGCQMQQIAAHSRSELGVDLLKCFQRSALITDHQSAKFLISLAHY